MATIRRDIPVTADPASVWDAVRDFGAVHERLVPGVLTSTELDGDARVVTFADGLRVREVIVAVDDDQRRLAYTVVGDLFDHHNASMQVEDDGFGGAQIIWVTDLLPDSSAQMVAALVEQGAAAMQATLAG